MALWQQTMLDEVGAFGRWDGRAGVCNKDFWSELGPTLSFSRASKSLLKENEIKSKIRKVCPYFCLRQFISSI
ncbi:hypothetical protein L484_017959 [Morus notabilis]|uniref:Uncharacterized protein n=1 Tax=Morus notabilis TaxID=981085 RepID=W9R247_9ROSA|nr:hypothetical protein L484_017959 [Morus notabilis]